MAELYHYGVKGMKWGVRRAIKQRDKAARKHDAYVDKYQKAKSSGSAEKAAKYESKAWKQRAKFEVASTKIKDLSPESVKMAEDFVKQLMSNQSQKNSASASQSSGGTKKKPYFKMTSQEREAFDATYTNKRKQLVDRYRASTNASEKARLMKTIDKLESDYLDEVERDW